MRKIFSALLAVGCALSVSADVILERFDSPDRVAGKILPAGKGEILLEGGTERGCLYAKGTKNNYQYIYSCPVKGQAGDKFALALTGQE